MSEFKEKIKKLKEGSYSQFANKIDNLPWIGCADDEGSGCEQVDFEKLRSRNTRTLCDNMGMW